MNRNKSKTTGKPWGTQDYVVAAAKSPIKVGDRVHVTRKARSYESGWDNTWEPSMDKAVGKTFPVTDGDFGKGFELKTNPDISRYSYPFFVLKKVRTRLEKKRT